MKIFSNQKEFRKNPFLGFVVWLILGSYIREELIINIEYSTYQ